MQGTRKAQGSSTLMLRILVTCFLVCSLPAQSRDIVETTFAYWNKPDIQVLYSAPPAITSETKILFIVHGASRTARKYFNDWLPLVQGRDVILVAPKFSKEFYNEYAYLMKTNKQGKRLSNTFLDLSSSLGDLYDFFSTKFNLKTTNFRLYGHSGGAQFVHRYLLLSDETRIDKVAIANAGFYTFADSSIRFPFGIKDMNVSENRLQWLLSLKGGMFLGDLDNDPKHKSLPSMRKARQQGRHRFERGTNFFNHLVELGVKSNQPFRWRYQVVPDVAHDNAGMSLAVSEFLLEDL
ncbi:hypothetical protein N9R25_03220 [Gammaproteobacteria bacterium]|nr:hypothetical protein [Gammaproteobacteria bacterium]